MGSSERDCTKQLGGGAAMHRVACTVLRPPSLSELSLSTDYYSARMSELIKENSTESLIAMTRLRTFALLGLVLAGLLLLSTTQHVLAYESGFVLSQTDEIRPTVYDWGIIGEPELGDSFLVWANVTDDNSGVRNVTVHVNGPNVTVHNLMTYNGSFYNAPVHPFPNSGTFNIYIRAYDMANNTRTSYDVNIIFEANPVQVIDPSVTMPIVVGSSLGLMAIVFGLAMFYDRRKGPGEKVMQPQYGG